MRYLEKYFSRSDNTEYALVDTKYGNVIKVLHSTVPGLEALYSGIEKSLAAYYQPIKFNFDEGVLVQLPEGNTFYVKDVYETDKGIEMGLFGLDTALLFPYKEQQVEALTKPILKHIRGDSAVNTDVFSSAQPSSIQLQKGVIEAWEDERGQCLFITGNDGTSYYVDGSLVHVDSSEQYFGTVSNGVHRIWKTHDKYFNEIVGDLPDSVSMYYDDQDNMYISGLGLTNQEQSFKIVLCRCDTSRVALTCVTQSNSIPFVVEFGYYINTEFWAYVNGTLLSFKY